MTSWRNLMTPLYEKYYQNDSCSSSLNQSNFSKATSQKNKEQFQASNYSDKLQELQSQMSKLKGDLSRYSGKENNANSGNKTTRRRKLKSPPNKSFFHQSTLSTPPQIKEESFENYKEERKDLDSESEEEKEGISSTIKPIIEEMTARTGKKENFQNMYIREDSCERDENDPIYEKETTRVKEKRIIKHSKTTSAIPRSPGEFSEGSKMKTVRFATQSSGQKFDHGNEKENDITTKAMVIDCCMQINELKQVARESQEQINQLTHQLGREKRKSHDLRENLQRNSSTIVYSHLSGMPSQETPQKEKEMKSRFTSPQTSQGVFLAKPRQVNSSLLKDRRKGYQNQELNSTTILNSTKERMEDDSTKDFSGFRNHHQNQQRDCGVQCDFLLDGIMNATDYEQQLEEKDAEIARLKAELGRMKEHKNEMIETFQQIVGRLTLHENDKKEALSNQKEIKSCFDDFYKGLHNKLNDVDSIEPAKKLIFPNNLQNSQFGGLQSSKFRLSSSKPFGASINNRTVITDNLLYSPSTAGFDEDLLESKYQFSIKPFKQASPLLQKTSLINTRLYNMISPKANNQ